MTAKNLFLKLDLQQFADDELPIDDNIETQPNDDLSGEDELFKALQSLRDSDDDDSDDADEDTDDTDNDTDDTDEDNTDTSDDVDDEEDDTPPVNEDTDTKKKQSKEDNAKFAAERRQKELDAKVQEELAKRLQDSPEMKLAKQLSEMYGVTPEVMLQQMREQALQKEAEDRKIPVEVLKERQADRERVSQVETELNQLRYESWQNKINADGQRLLGEYKMLGQEDIDSAVDYILRTVRNVEIPLEDALYAVHGKKIIDALANQKIQDDLATKSGRKVPPTPKNSKSSKVGRTLDADEKYIAKQFNMTDEEYLKYQG